MTYRCTPASRDEGEPLLGTAPTEEAWLLVQHEGPWGARALAESDLPAEVRDRLLGLAGVRVQLLRRHGRAAPSPGVQVYAARLGDSGPLAAVAVAGAVLGDVRELLELDLDGLADPAASGPGAIPAGLDPHVDPLWLVCTNGRRDLCCADLGRPVAGALAARWPEETWETTHLGGHRFAATMLSLPAGLALGRLEPSTAVAACAALAAGAGSAHADVRGVLRGRAGRPAPQQVAEAVAGGVAGGLVDDWSQRAEELPAGPEETVRASAPDGTAYDVVVRTVSGRPRRHSCADLAEKAAPEHHATAVRRVEGAQP